jgi:signal transduction histidine kinase
MTTNEHSYLELLSLAVHEFRTPATIVAGYLRMLQQDTGHPLDAQQRKMVDEAVQSCMRLVALVKELSEVANLDAGTAQLGRQSFDLFPTILDVAASVQELDHKVSFQLRGASEGAMITGDLTRLRTAIAAIFHAIQREKPEPCEVVVERRVTRIDGVRSAVIVIADESRVQTAYDSPAVAFDEKRGGLGLALPIARRGIEAHGGRLWAPASLPAAEARSTALIAMPLEHTS